MGNQKVTLVKRDTIFFLIWRVVLILGLVAAILDQARIFDGEFNWKTFCSFTTLCTGYVMLITLLDTLKVCSANEKASLWLSRFRSLGVMIALMTGLIFHFILTPHEVFGDFQHLVFRYGNIVTHYVGPACIFIDWLLFDVKGRIGKWEPFVYISLPAAYLLLSLIYGYLGLPIPGRETSFTYDFMDWEVLGVAAVIKWLAALLVGLLTLAYLIYFIDKALAKRSRNK